MYKYIENIFLEVLKDLGYWESELKIIFEEPKVAKYGDLSTNISMIIAKRLKKNPREIASEIVNKIIDVNKYFTKVEIAGAGFINITLNDKFYLDNLSEIKNKKDTFGKNDLGKGKKTQVEFVSANPTGLLHLGHGRQAAIGDTIANLYSWIGYNVTREYYFNNAGRQMKLLTDSVYARYKQITEPDFPFPEDGYFGDYIKDIASEIYKNDKNKTATDLTYFKEYAENYLFNEIKKTLDKMGVYFDVYYNEDSLYKKGKIEEVVKLLDQKGLIYKEDGATWFSAEKIDPSLEPRVIIKSSGEPTYRLPDIAYHREKYLRGFDLIIDIFGADHIATYPDVMAGMKALDFPVEKMKILIHQFVTLLKDGEIVKMSKRNADMVTLDELIDEVGKDAVRFFLVNRSISSHLEFDINLAKERSEKNPVYYLQYAHARISSILRFALEQGFDLDGNVNINLLKERTEIDLIKAIIKFPDIIESAALTFEPHRLTNYLYDLATVYHKFYHDHRVVSEERDLSSVRLTLCIITKTILANGLKILGISAPERM
jgi:arginyl-tRNA synthetase